MAELNPREIELGCSNRILKRYLGFNDHELIEFV